MEAQEVAQDPAAVVQAHMAVAARTAEALDRLVAVQGEQLAPKEEGRGLSVALYKVLKPSEAWKPQSREQEHATWMEFVLALKAYLVALDEKLEEDLIEGLGKNAKTAIKMEDMEEGNRKQGTIHYAVLTSLVQGGPQKLLKAVAPGNRFEWYRQLAEQTTPQARARP